MVLGWTGNYMHIYTLLGGWMADCHPWIEHWMDRVTALTEGWVVDFHLWMDRATSIITMVSMYDKGMSTAPLDNPPW